MTNPAHLMILQASDKAIINWESFSIAPGEITQFAQPGAGSIALNRVTGGDVSAWMGTLTANGGVILVNPNGILVGGGGVVDVGGMTVLSTLDIDDADFLDGGEMRFFGDSAAGVTNLGTITSRGGDVVLLGTDGVFDNLFIDEVVGICNEMLYQAPGQKFRPLDRHLLGECAKRIVLECHAKTQPGLSGEGYKDCPTLQLIAIFSHCRRFYMI